MRQKSEAGFSYIDVMISLVILTVGILALLAGLSGAVLQSKGQEQQLIARQLSTSTMESIMAVKETTVPARLGWNAVGNVGSNPNALGIPQGIFLVGFQQAMSDAGPDRVLGTIDDDGTVLSGVQRRIVISDICDPQRPSSICTPPGTFRVRMRQVQVTITYFVGTLQRQELLTTVLTDYGTAN